MQKFFQLEESKIISKYAMEESSLRYTKERDCDNIRKRMAPGRKEQDRFEKVEIGIVVASIIFALIVAPDFFSGILIIIVLSVLGVFAAKNAYKNWHKDKLRQMEEKVSQRESQFTRDLQQINDKKDKERKQLGNEINLKMNKFARQYAQSTTTKFLVEWMLNALKIQIDKADRSPWLPQVKASMNFNVSFTKLEIPGFGNYDMAGMGIHIDDDPVAVSALTYVLEQALVKEAQVRYSRDINGGISVITSCWDKNTSVDILYSAPNGGVKTLS